MKVDIEQDITIYFDYKRNQFSFTPVFDAKTLGKFLVSIIKVYDDLFNPLEAKHEFKQGLRENRLFEEINEERG